MRKQEISQAVLMVKYEYTKKNKYISDSDALKLATERVRVRHLFTDDEGPVLSGEVNVQDADR